MTWTMKWRTPWWWHGKQPASQSSNGYHPKRRCLRQWHAVLGAPYRKRRMEGVSIRNTVLIAWSGTMTPCSCAMEIIIASFRGKLVQTTFLSVAGEGAASYRFQPIVGVRTALMRDLNSSASKIQLGNLSLKLTGYTIFVTHPNGTFYVLHADGRRVQRLADSKLIPVIRSEQLPKDQQFVGWTIRVLKEEVLFIHRSTSLRSQSSFQLPWSVFYRPIFCNSRWTIIHHHWSWQREDSNCAMLGGKALPGQKLEGVDFKIRSRCKMSAV